MFGTLFSKSTRPLTTAGTRSLRGAALALALTALGTAAPGWACADIFLNEILADPARDWNGSGAVSSRDDEWVEVINAGATAVDLSGWRVAGPDSIWRYEFSGVLQPGQVQVCYGKQSYDWEVANGFPAFGLRLSNSGGELLLFQMVGTTPVLRDRYAYTDHEAEDDRSSGRSPDGGPHWALFDALTPYSGTEEPLGNACAPSPGTRQTCVTPVQPTTWSSLKALYRS